MTPPNDAERPLDQARRWLEQSVVHFDDRPIGTVAARDDRGDALNYDQVFVRDFVPAGLAFLSWGESEIVRGFLQTVLDLQIQDPHLDCHVPGRGAMPASFKVRADEQGRERLEADYGDKAIGRVAPADSVFWWLFLLRAYVRATGDHAFMERSDVQRGIARVLTLCLPTQFDLYPALLVPEGAFMIDRRMGVYGYPLEIQALFQLALRAALELWDGTPADAERGEADLGQAGLNHAVIRQRMGKLAYYVRANYWLDLDRLNEIYRARDDEYGAAAANQFNVNPDAIPAWLYDWLPSEGGYLVGNVGPGRMDFRFFTQGNLLAVLGSLVDAERADALMALIGQRWEALVGHMPMKLVYPALTGEAWELLTGRDPKNTPWSYHNGGHWPVLLWLWTAACLQTDRGAWAEQALEMALRSLPGHDWPEYYDGKHGRLIGKRARRRQTWSMAGPLMAQALLDDPDRLDWIAFRNEPPLEACPL